MAGTLGPLTQELTTLANGTQKNKTDSSGEMTPLQQANSIILAVLLIIIMISMGCTTTVSDLKRHLKRPWGPVIGIILQFGFIPLTAYALANALQLSGPLAIGLIMISTCPGGTVSNIYSFWALGDVALSITMTTCSTVIAMGMMPLNLWIYSRTWTDRQAQIPYLDVVVSLLLILVPVGIGMIIKWKNDKVAFIITKVGSYAGMIVIVAVAILLGIASPGLFTSSWTVWFAGILMPIIGTSYGFIASSICCRPWPQRRTIATESGLQNMALCLAIVQNTFPPNQSNEVSLIPLLVGAFMNIEGLAWIIVYRIVLRVKNKGKVPDADNEYNFDHKDIKSEAIIIDSNKQPNGLQNGHVNHGIQLDTEKKIPT
ncbi:unnamed protein product [Owenia fusiformis]|uniref:Uncharacterized protein n=1 Tax=Owenia fusiformis TaxID=6347 RepID=A0A8J1UL63_OWEFU|nr:unnamed protein product [Owenia fusiformis]